MAHGARPAGMTAVSKISRSALTVYRVTRAIHPAFDGTGTARFGARWTSPGRVAIYAAGSYAGALMEILAHARRHDLKVAYQCLVIVIPEHVRVIAVEAKAAPGWDSRDYVVSRGVGDRWLQEKKSAVLRVPSVTGSPHEYHFIFNPLHADVSKLKLGKPHAVTWDDRLLAQRPARQPPGQ